LFAQGSNQRKVELFPVDEQTYFNNFTEALITFETETAADVTAVREFTLRQASRVRTGVRVGS